MSLTSDAWQLMRMSFCNIRLYAMRRISDRKKASFFLHQRKYKVLNAWRTLLDTVVKEKQ